MTQQPTRKRLRRGSTDNDNDTTNFVLTDSDQATVPLNIEQNLNNTSEQPPINLPNSTIAKLDLDSIRTELLNDFHHEDLSESDYWDESHNWSVDSESPSDEYWHFLGRYE